MNALRWLGVAAMVVVLNTSTQGSDDYPKLIVGKWEVTKADEGTVAPGCTIEFSKDGKVKADIKKGEEREMLEGTYKIEKDTLIVTMKKGAEDKPDKITITKLTEKELITKHEDGKVVELKKK
jgi:uncharacterized protein (TIGR03066 family)